MEATDRGNFILGNPNARRSGDDNVIVGYFPHGVLPADPEGEPTITMYALRGGISLGPTLYSLREFLTTLGITPEDVAKALDGGDTHEET